MTNKNTKFAMVCNVAIYGIEAMLTASAIKRTGKLWPLTMFFVLGGVPSIPINPGNLAKTWQMGDTDNTTA